MWQKYEIHHAIPIHFLYIERHPYDTRICPMLVINNSYLNFNCALYSVSSSYF